MVVVFLLLKIDRAADRIDDGLCRRIELRLLDRATTPLARLGSPEEIARAVHYLATAPFVSGQILAVDGGRSAYL